MKKRWLGIRIIIGLCAALGWWGLLYPELALTPDTVKISADKKEEEVSGLPEEWSFGSSLYQDLLNTDRGQIKFRSRLLTDIGLFLEALGGFL